MLPELEHTDKPNIGESQGNQRKPIAPVPGIRKMELYVSQYQIATLNAHIVLESNLHSVNIYSQVCLDMASPAFQFAIHEFGAKTQNNH